MRAHEFTQTLILREYRRDVTAQALGYRMIMALANTPGAYLPDSLYNAHTVADIALYPDRYANARPMRLDIMGQLSPPLSITNAKEVLAQLKPKIVNAVLAEIESHDPTPNKEYSQWLARAWVNSEGKTKLEDLNRNDLLLAYTVGKRKRQIKPEHADINKFKTWPEFEAMIRQYPVAEWLKIAATGTQGYGNAKVINTYPDVTIVIPLDLDASRRAAGGMGEDSAAWCTKGENMFNHYTRQGPLYVLLPKNPGYEGEKYQLHFPTAQFKDETDASVDIVNLLTVRFPGLLEFFKKTEPDINNLVIFTDDDVLAPLLDRIAEICEEHIWDTVYDWEQQDDYFRDWQGEQAIERGYVNSDGDIDWDRVHEDDALNDYLEFNHDAKSWYRDASKSVRLTPLEAKKLAAEMAESGDYDNVLMQDLEAVVAFSVRSSDDLSRWIGRTIRIKYVEDKDPGVGSGWRVTRVRY